jgi:hypothetical protein
MPERKAVLFLQKKPGRRRNQKDFDHPVHRRLDIPSSAAKRLAFRFFVIT